MIQKMRIVYGVLIATTLAVLTSCFEDNIRSSIKQSVEQMNKECPVASDAYSSITSVELDNDTVVYKVLTSEEVWGVDLLKNSEEITKKLIKLGLFQEESHSDREDLMKMASHGYWIKWIYLGQKSKKRYSLLLSPEELQKGLDKPMRQEEMSEALLQLMIQREASMVPIELETGFVMKEIRLEEDALIYLYDLDENNYDIGLMRSNKSEIKKEIGTDIISYKHLLRALIKTNRKLIYKYVGNRSGKFFPITFEKNELEDIIAQTIQNYDN